MNGLHFELTSMEMTPFDISLLNGTWQNALGKTYAFNIEQMRMIECSDDSRVLSSGPLYDKAGGCGPYITGDEILYPCLSTDGNALVLFADGNALRVPGSHGTGVFYRNGDVEMYADLENASFGETDGRLWYCDGIQYFALSGGYTLSEDGRAYDRTNKPFAPNWEEDRYAPISLFWRITGSAINDGKEKENDMKNKKLLESIGAHAPESDFACGLWRKEMVHADYGGKPHDLSDFRYSYQSGIG